MSASTSASEKQEEEKRERKFPDHPPEKAWGKPDDLPFGTRFVGVKKFEKLMARARKAEWVKLPLGKRIATIGKALCGTPYKSYTLEIDDFVEAPSVNMEGLDCWTFFEVALAVARLLERPVDEQTPQAMLDLIELDRYRGGKCDGHYLSRLHYLTDWMRDNEKRGLVREITQELVPEEELPSLPNIAREMSIHWKSYRYLNANPDLLPLMAKHEQRITDMHVVHIPQAMVWKAEKTLQDGDIIGITSKYNGAYVSHVGLALRDSRGVLRFMHASSHKKKRVCLIDARMTDYLKASKSRIGIIVARAIK